MAAARKPPQRRSRQRARATPEVPAFGLRGSSHSAGGRTLEIGASQILRPQPSLAVILKNTLFNKPNRWPRTQSLVSLIVIRSRGIRSPNASQRPTVACTYEDVLTRF